jgi:hypothetical protein
MALSQSALSELLDAIRAGEGTDVLRDAMALVFQELIELEATQAIGAARYERTEERTSHRNGSRSRLLSTKAGDGFGVTGSSDLATILHTAVRVSASEGILTIVLDEDETLTVRHPAPGNSTPVRASAT